MTVAVENLDDIGAVLHGATLAERLEDTSAEMRRDVATFLARRPRTGGWDR